MRVSSLMCSWRKRKSKSLSQVTVLHRCRLVFFVMHLGLVKKSFGKSVQRIIWDIWICVICNQKQNKTVTLRLILFEKKILKKSQANNQVNKDLNVNITGEQFQMMPSNCVISGRDKRSGVNLRNGRLSCAIYNWYIPVQQLGHHNFHKTKSNSFWSTEQCSSISFVAHNR